MLEVRAGRGEEMLIALVAFAFGLCIGAVLGILMAGLCVAASDADRAAELAAQI
jgi:hypothetical protein